MKSFSEFLEEKEAEAKLVEAKKEKWAQEVSKEIKAAGHEGVCTGKKFGGPTCKPGSKRYVLAKTFRKMAKKRKSKKNK